MKKIFVIIAIFSLVLTGCMQVVDSGLAAGKVSVSERGLEGAAAKGGFDELGYNRTAGIFNGPADGTDGRLDGTVWGDPTYARDRLVMKWSKAWTEAKASGVWTPEAWETNEWNGKVPGGSGEVWHYKIIWVGSELANSPHWVEGGYAIWGQFEVVMSHGTVLNEHFWDVHAKPSGF